MNIHFPQDTLSRSREGGVGGGANTPHEERTVQLPRTHYIHDHILPRDTTLDHKEKESDQSYRACHTSVRQSVTSWLTNGAESAT